MSDIVKRDVIDFYGNQMIVQLVRNDPDDPLKRFVSCSIKFYGKKFMVMPIWHPWFGPVFMSTDDYAPAGISPFIIPTPLALEYGDQSEILYAKEGFERIITETEIRMIEQLPDTVKEYHIKYSIDNGRYNTYKKVETNLRNYVAFEVIKEPTVKGIFMDPYIPVNGIFFEYSDYGAWSEKTIYIPKSIIPSNMEINAKSMYNIIAQQHKDNYDKYVASVFREIAQSDTTKILWTNTTYWFQLDPHIDDTPPYAIMPQIIQKTKYGITIGRERYE